MTDSSRRWRHVEDGESEDECYANTNSYRRNPHLRLFTEPCSLEYWYNMDRYQSLAYDCSDNHLVDLELMSLFADYYRLYYIMDHGFQSILQQQLQQVPYTSYNFQSSKGGCFEDNADIAEEQAHIELINSVFDEISLSSPFSPAVTLEIGEKSNYLTWFTE